MKTPKKLSEREMELVRCVNFAVKFLDPKHGGCVLRTDEKGESKMESFVSWFLRALKPYGIEYDSELLDYQRASQKHRKQMLKDPEFAAKLAKNRESK